ncbi:unnamed protein product [Acanthoscelides obtectus]|uniref:Uncharacterized protein n=1 Tax=Acanthoscelides obtectus TaxID=200917 RepID=A0A9P0KSN2_ACAOB|nr:unnamed protein product [Acanthoscelides obtectus]CAK1677635.1 hypothetical protein AOBTE_LOCUS31447 [Acanthoscelides obtectus]
MCSLRLEAVLVSDVGDSIYNTVWAHVAVLTTNCDRFVISARVYYLSVFVFRDTVRLINPVNNSSNIYTYEPIKSVNRFK